MQINGVDQRAVHIKDHSFHSFSVIVQARVAAGHKSTNTQLCRRVTVTRRHGMYERHYIGFLLREDALIRDSGARHDPGALIACSDARRLKAPAD